MTRRNRETLKNFFKEGRRPDEDHFADLIDSMLNMSDEGFRMSVENGQELSAAAGHDALLSFFRAQSPESPLWSLRLGGAGDQLLVRGPLEGGAQPADPEEPLLCLDPGGRVGVGIGEPQTALDVAGSVRSRGRRGAFPGSGKTPLADGNWHDLTGDLIGCQALEVVAGVAHRGRGRVALLHAVALNTFNPTWGILDFLNRRRGIRATHATYSRRVDRLALRWRGTSGKNACYRLQIRTGSAYGAAIPIRAHVTSLWDDALMESPGP